MNEHEHNLKSFNLDSFGVLLSNSYANILASDSDLSKLQGYLTSDDVICSEEVSTKTLVEIYKAITARQRNNIQLLTQFMNISNRNEQIKLLLAELTRIKEASVASENIPKLSPNTQAALLGLRKIMLEKVESGEAYDGGEHI